MIGIGLSGIFLYLALRKVDLLAVRAALANAKLVWVIPMIAISLINFWLRAIRWASMFPAFARPRAAQAFNALMIGGLANNVVAGRVGDVARAGLIGQIVPQIGTGGALATIVLERVMDGLVLVALLGVALLAGPLPAWVVRTGFVGALLFSGVLLLLFVLALRNKTGVHSIVSDELQRTRAGIVLRRLFSRFVGGLAPLKNAAQFVGLLSLTVVVWLLDISLMFVGFRVLGLALPFLAAIVGVVLLALGMMVPGAPGFIGTYQFFVVTALGLYSVSGSQALAMALFLNVFVFALSTALGLVVLAVSGLRWSSWMPSAVQLQQEG
jgi:uncharacterized protein (TIRG00374 family)